MLHSSHSAFVPTLDEAPSSPTRAVEIAVICHELRNSLSVIRGAARLMRLSADAGGLKTSRSIIERQVDQMSRHIDDLLQPLHRNGHDHGLQLADADLRGIARNAIDAIEPEIVRRGHHLTVSLPEKPVRARVDAARLEQAISNLLINATKYTPDGGNISLILETDRDLARVHIRDSGIGIEPAMLSRIFGLFVQVDSAPHSAEQGSGIGLAVVASIVELHGGIVKAASPGLGRGSKFTIVLPVAPRA